ncbi:MAG: hypothetical protein NTU88_12665, partial [Armatimonadetes bacterium]|nr:hypothetical protein [Armatimonadota bacterium]
KKTTGDTPVQSDLDTEVAGVSGQYIKTWPTCPSDGTSYPGINAIGTAPICASQFGVPGGTHVLP